MGLIDRIRSILGMRLTPEPASEPEDVIAVECTACGGWAAFTGRTQRDEEGRVMGMYACGTCGETFPAWSRRNEEAVLAAEATAVEPESTRPTDSVRPAADEVQDDAAPESGDERAKE